MQKIRRLKKDHATSIACAPSVLSTKSAFSEYSLYFPKLLKSYYHIAYKCKLKQKQTPVDTGVARTTLVRSRQGRSSQD